MEDQVEEIEALHPALLFLVGLVQVIDQVPVPAHVPRHVTQRLPGRQTPEIRRHFLAEVEVLLAGEPAFRRIERAGEKSRYGRFMLWWLYSSWPYVWGFGYALACAAIADAEARLTIVGCSHRATAMTSSLIVRADAALVVVVATLALLK